MNAAAANDMRRVYPQSSWQSVVSPWPPPDYSGNIKLTIDTAFNDALKAVFEPPTKNKEQSMSSSTTQRALEAVRDLEASELPTISQEVKALLERNKARIVQSLKGAADLAIMSKSKGSRFVIVYWRNNKVNALEGVDYAKDQYIEEKRESDALRVYVDGSDYPVSGTQSSMNTLRKIMDTREIPYHIAYFE